MICKLITYINVILCLGPYGFILCSKYVQNRQIDQTNDPQRKGDCFSPFIHIHKIVFLSGR